MADYTQGIYTNRGSIMDFFTESRLIILERLLEEHTIILSPSSDPSIDVTVPLSDDLRKIIEGYIQDLKALL